MRRNLCNLRRFFKRQKSPKIYQEYYWAGSALYRDTVDLITGTVSQIAILRVIPRFPYIAHEDYAQKIVVALNQKAEDRNTKQRFFTWHRVELCLAYAMGQLVLTLLFMLVHTFFYHYLSLFLFGAIVFSVLLTVPLLLRIVF